MRLCQWASEPRFLLFKKKKLSTAFVDVWAVDPNPKLREQFRRFALQTATAQLTKRRLLCITAETDCVATEEQRRRLISRVLT